MSRETSFAGGSQPPEISRCQQMVSQAITEANLPQAYCPIINRQIGVIMSRPNSPAGSLASGNGPLGAANLTQSAGGRMQGRGNSSFPARPRRRETSMPGNVGAADFGYRWGSPVLGPPPSASPISSGGGSSLSEWEPQFRSSPIQQLNAAWYQPVLPQNQFSLSQVLQDMPEGASGTGGDATLFEGRATPGDIDAPTIDFSSLYGERYFEPHMARAGFPRVPSPPNIRDRSRDINTAESDQLTKFLRKEDKRKPGHDIWYSPEGSWGVTDSEYESGYPEIEVESNPPPRSPAWPTPPPRREFPPAVMTPDQSLSAEGRLQGMGNFDASYARAPSSIATSAPGAFFNDTGAFSPCSPMVQPMRRMTGRYASPIYSSSSGSSPPPPPQGMRQMMGSPLSPGSSPPPQPMFRMTWDPRSPIYSPAGSSPSPVQQPQRRVISVPPRDQWPKGYNTSDSSSGSSPPPIAHPLMDASGGSAAPSEANYFCGGSPPSSPANLEQQQLNPPNDFDQVRPAGSFIPYQARRNLAREMARQPGDPPLDTSSDLSWEIQGPGFIGPKLPIADFSVPNIVQMPVQRRPDASTPPPIWQRPSQPRPRSCWPCHRTPPIRSYVVRGDSLRMALPSRPIVQQPQRNAMPPTATGCLPCVEAPHSSEESDFYSPPVPFHRQKMKWGGRCTMC